MQIDAFSKLIVRLPSFPFSFLKNILHLNNDQWVESILKNEMFMQGIMVASPEFYSQVNNYELCDNYSKKEKIRLTLLKYVIRSSTRCVPFGLFSGLGVLDINNTTKSKNGYVVLNKMNQFTRLDSGYSSYLIDEINSMPALQDYLTYYVNTTLYEKSNSYRYVNYKLTTTAIRKYELMQFTKNRYLNDILLKSRKGIKFNELVKLLVDFGFEDIDSIYYINQLIATNVLVSELEPSSVGISNEEKCLQVLTTILKEENGNEIIQSLHDFFFNIKEKLAQIDAKSPNESYLDSLLFQENIVKNLKVKENKIFNKDLFFKAHQNITHNQNKLLHKGISIFNSLTHFNNSSNKSRLDLFKDEFFARYEYESVRLLDVLDVESGIGYDLTLKSFGTEDNFLTNNFPKNNVGGNTKSITWNSLDSFLIRKIEKANSDFSNTLEIYEDDVKNISVSKIENQNKTKSYTGCVRYSLYKDKEDNDVVYIDSISKSSPNKVLGRFSNGNKEVHDLMKEVSSFEDDFFGEDTIVAEIDHLPFSGFGNTLSRVNTRKYIISYQGAVKADSNNMIPISDLYISFHNDKIVLFSKKLKKRIIPFFSNAFNDDLPNILPVFKFLFDLHYQYEDRLNGYFDVNKYLDFFKHIPRISSVNIILSKETWIVSKRDFICSNEDSIDKIISDFKQNCSSLRLPTFFMIVNGDIELLIDTNNFDTIKIFIAELKKKKSLILKEFLMSNLDSVVIDEENNDLQFNNEFFFPFKFKVEKSNKIIIKKNKTESIERNFPVGSEWIYYKIYLGANMADKILINLQSKLNVLVKKGMIKLYFFIKYNDPDYHIRLRLLLTDKSQFDIVFKEINEHLSKFVFNKDINNIVLDTYKRELERYGYSDIFTFETLFYYDSKLVIKILNQVEKKKNIETKWFYTLIVMDIYCNAFGFSNEDKMMFAESSKKDFSVEFRANSETTKFMLEKYSYYKNDLLHFFDDYKYKRVEFNFKMFEQEVSLTLKKFQHYSIEKKKEYLKNIIHMHIIRLLGAQNNRLYEFIIYDFYLKITKHTYFKNMSKFII